MSVSTCNDDAHLWNCQVYELGCQIVQLVIRALYIVRNKHRCAAWHWSCRLNYSHFSVHTAYTRCTAYTRHRCSKCLRRCSVLLDSLCTRKCIVISTAVVSATRRCVDDVLFMMSTAVICSYFVWQLLPPPLANIYSAVAVDVVQFDWKLQTETSVKTAPNILIFLRLYLLKN